MFEVNFCNCFPNLRKDLASEELAQRSEDLLRCLWLGTDALLLLPACSYHICRGLMACLYGDQLWDTTCLEVYLKN